MADRKPYYVRIGETGKIVRIVATSEQDALDQSEKINLATTPIVEMRNKAEGSALLKYPDGREIIVSPSYSTSDPDKVAAFKEGATAGDLSTSMTQQGLLQEAERASPFGRATGPIVAASQAMGFGAGSWLDEFVDSVVGGKSGEALRAIQKAQASERPAETLFAQLGVGLAEGYAILKRFPQLANLLGGTRASGLVGSTVRSAAVSTAGGAATGAVSGAGEAQPGERLEGAGRGALTGGLVGGAIGSATPLVAAGGRNVANIIRRSDIPMIASALRISKQAAEVIKSAFDAGGDIDTAVQNLQRAGDVGMLADAGPAAQALLDASASTGGQGQLVERALKERAETVTQGLSQKLDATLGADILTPSQAADMISAKTSSARTKAYDAAYAQPIDYASQAGMNIETVLDRVDPTIMDQAIKKANAMMRAAGKKNQQIKATIGDDGEVSFSQMPNVIQLDYIKRGLNSLAENARGPLGQATDETLLYGGLARDLRGAIGEAVVDPQTGARLYDDAVTLGGEKIAEQNAFKLGREALKPQTEIGDVLEELGPQPSQAQIEAAKLGMRQHIRTVLENVKGVPSDQELAARQLDAFYRLTSSDAARKKIMRIMGDEAEQLLAEIDKVAQTAKVRSATAINSKTAQRLAIQRDIEDMTSEGFLGQFLRGEPLNSAKELVKAITGRTDQYTFKKRQQIFEDIARALTETKGPQARQIIEIIDKAQRGQIVTQAENDLMVNEIAGALSLMSRGALQPQAQEMLPQ